jgi:hypothetical protein
MQIKFKKENKDGVTRVESRTRIKQIFINPEIVDRSSESIAIAFKGVNDSGFIEISRDEINYLLSELNKKRHLFGN